MKQSKITTRYAKSLLGLVLEKNLLEETVNDMRLIKSVCSTNKDFSLLLKSPIVKTDKKLSIFNKIFSNTLNELSIAFVNIITTKKREMHLEGIAESFILQYKSYKKIETATVTTAVQIDDQTRKEILTYISKQGNTNIELTEIIDENIIGGTIITMGDKQLDTSISRTIKELRQKLHRQEVKIEDFVDLLLTDYWEVIDKK